MTNADMDLRDALLQVVISVLAVVVNTVVIILFFTWGLFCILLGVVGMILCLFKYSLTEVVDQMLLPLPMKMIDRLRNM